MVSWLTRHGQYLALGPDDEKRQAAYRGLFATEIDQQLLREIRVSTFGGYVIGSGRFRRGATGSDPVDWNPPLA